MIEALELGASFEEQLRYKSDVPIANVPAEVICLWHDTSPEDDWPAPPVFSKEEVLAVLAYTAAIKAACAALPGVRSLEDLQREPAWHTLRDAANVGLCVFTTRGRFSEDVEERFPPVHAEELAWFRGRETPASGARTTPLPWWRKIRG